MKIVAVTQARMGSSRLPGKILREINNISLLEIHLERIKNSRFVDDIIVATTTKERDSEIIRLCEKLNVATYRGSEEDVLDRFYQALVHLKPDYVVRLTSDCPLIDSILIDKVVRFTKSNNLDYGSNTLRRVFPDGQDVEVFKFNALRTAWESAELKSEREHVTPYIWKNSSSMGGELFLSDNYSEDYNFGEIRMTVDEEEDFEVIKRLVEALGIDKTWLEYTKFLIENPSIKNINSKYRLNEGYEKSLKNDQKLK